MKGASTAPLIGCSRDRRLIAYILVSIVDSLPVAGSIRRILIPDQKLPHTSQACVRSSMTRLGSIAFQSSVSSDERSTIPSSTHR